MSEHVVWRTAAFAELSAQDVYDVLRLRQDVFVVEQNCVFPDIDGIDQETLHVLGRRGGRLIAYARIFEPGQRFDEACIGRIVTDPSVRGTGLGHELFRESLEVVQRIAPGAPIRLAAQAHLERFYGAYGFVVAGDRYLEDGIVHVHMVRAADAGASGTSTARS